MWEHIIQLAVKGNRKHIAQINTPNLAFPNHDIDKEISHGSKDLVIGRETV